ncbi:MAG: hypothetical protein FJW30_01530 [Acidobacteria bacterium]|nr:hypothetical protein [Acidobacteriota bacterium]
MFYRWAFVSAALCAAPPPKVESVFPVSGQPGSSFAAQIRGSNLRDAYAVWFEGAGAAAEILKIEADPKRKNAEIAFVTVRLAAGFTKASFRAVTPGGVSNALLLSSHPEEAVLEQAAAHDIAAQAQRIARLPAAIHGRIGESGEVDFYSIRVEAGESWTFETVSSEALDPSIGIYRPGGSWFDSERPIRIAFSDEAVSYPNLTTEVSLTHRFEKAGEYFLRVNGFWGHGGPGQEYTLRIHQGPARSAEKANDWTERSWTRSLTTDRMTELAARAAPAAAKPIPIVDADAEPSQVPVVPPAIPVPALVTGAIERPGDVDRVRFSAKEGDKLAFEIETPETTLPLMNPYLRVLDSDGVEAFTNVFSNVNSNGNASKQIRPKTMFSFPRGGDFILEIRDITAAYGDAGMKYKVLVRPQLGHMGEVKIAADALNLEVGKASKLSVVTDQEEGYEGFVILSIDGLPDGVRAMPATEVEPDSPPQESMAKRERFATKSQKATIVLAPGDAAPLTRLPVVGRVHAQPVVGGKLGARIFVKEIPIMVVKGGA